MAQSHFTSTLILTIHISTSQKIAMNMFLSTTLAMSPYLEMATHLLTSLLAKMLSQTAQPLTPTVMWNLLLIGRLPLTP